MKNTPVILIVDDTRSELFLLEGHLQAWGYATLSANNARNALELFRNHRVDLVISDQQMDGMDGLELLQQVKQVNPAVRFIMLTAYEDIPKAVTAMKYGADDYLSKPYEPGEFQAKIAQLLDYPWLMQETQEQAAEAERFSAFSNMITASPKMKSIFKYAANIAKSPKTTNLLITGETGTGKELLARAIHLASGGVDENFIAVNCAAIPSELLESELFGHVKGAFTGATTDKKGKFDFVRDGTLLLDEIGDMPLQLQAKLLRVLQEGCYEHIGSHRLIPIKGRIICATHRDLRDAVEQGMFREDLYHRINRCPISIPPLRERKEDIPLLVNHFVEYFRQQQNKYVPGVSTEAMGCLFNYDWPGNVRELEHCIENAVIRVENGQIRSEDLTISKTRRFENADPPRSNENRIDDHSVRLVFESAREEFSLDAVIRHVLQTVLAHCGNNKTSAANLLRVDRKRFYRMEGVSDCLGGTRRE